jgi:addiction module HigA family antidote
MTQTTTRRLPTHRPPTHPGEMLLEEFLLKAKPKPITAYAFAKATGMSIPRTSELTKGERPMTPDTALRVAQATGTEVGFWLQLQLDWDVWHLQRKVPAEVKKIKRLPAFAGQK